MKNRISMAIAMVVIGLLMTVLPKTSLGRSQQPTDPRLVKVFNDWKRRYERFRCVAYLAQGDTTMPRGAFTDPSNKDQSPIPKADLKASLRYRLILDFANHRHRLEDEHANFHLPTLALLNRSLIQTFDGKALKGWLRDEPPQGAKMAPMPDVGISTGDFSSAAFDYQYAPFFMAHGIIRANRDAIIPGQLKPNQDESTFYLHGEAQLSGRPCLVIRTRPLRADMEVFDEFWVDLEYESSVLRFTKYSDRKPFIDQLIRYQNTTDSWLPTSWINTQYDVATRKVLNVRAISSIESTVEPKLQEADFDIKVEPGMLVARAKLPAPRNPMTPTQPEDVALFRVQPDGSWRQVTIENGVEYSRDWRFAWWAWLVGLSTLLLAGIWFFRIRSIRTRAINEG